MQYAILEAQEGESHHEMPIGAIAFMMNPSGVPVKILSSAHNQVEQSRNPLLHAEILLLQHLCRQFQEPFLPDIWIMSTLEPCPLCAAALVRHRIGGVVFGAYNTQDGGVIHQKFPRQIPVVGGIRETECQKLLDDFFTQHRK